MICMFYIRAWYEEFDMKSVEIVNCKAGCEPRLFI